MFFMQYEKEGNKTTVESKKCLSYIIVIISMVIRIIIGALGTVTKRLADNYNIIKLKIFSKVAPRQTKLLGTLRSPEN